MVLRRMDRPFVRMRLYWVHVWRSAHYQRAGAEEKRLIELRFVLARKLQKLRRRCRVTQKQLAVRIDVAQATISRAERASNRVSLDIAVRALINLGCPDEEIGAAFNASADRGVQLLRRRQAGGGPPPRLRDAGVGEQRFLRKGTEELGRLK